MNIAAIILLAVSLAYACLQHAGVVPDDWLPCVLAIGIVASVYFLIPRRHHVPRMPRLAWISAFAAVGLAILQLAPLPVGLVHILSPARVELLHATAPVTAGIPRFVTLTVTPYASAIMVLSLAAYAVVFLLVRDATIRLSRFPWATVWPLLVVTALEAILGFAQAYSAGLSNATGTYNSWDHYAGLLEMALPFPAMYAVAILRRSRGPRGVPARAALAASGMMIVSALLLIAIVFSLCRTGFFCALIALVVTAVLAVSVRGWREEEDAASAPPWRRRLPAVAIVLVVAAGFLALPSAPLIARFSDLAHTEDITADMRAQLWRDTVPLIRDYPLFGCGLGTYESCFLQYKTVAPMNTADFAHNDYLQVLAEFGIVGFAAGFVFVFRVLAGVGRTVVYAHSIDERCRSIACVAAMTAMLLHSLVDFNMYVPANAMVFAWIAGIAGASLQLPRRAADVRMPN